MDKLRRKEEKKQRRGSGHDKQLDFGAEFFSSLLQASERKSPFDNMIGTGQELTSSSVTSLPQGTTRSVHKGYEEVKVPPSPTAAMKVDERLVFSKLLRI